MDGNYDFMDQYFLNQDYPCEEDNDSSPFDDSIYNTNFNEFEEFIPNSLVLNGSNTDSSNQEESLSQQNSKLKPTDSKSKTRQKRTDITPLMSDAQLDFMHELYKHFKGSSKMPIKKEILMSIYHPLIAKKLAICYNYKIRPKASRDEQRKVKLYFMAFAKDKDYIMKAIDDLEQEGKINYPRDREEYLRKKKDSSK